MHASCTCERANVRNEDLGPVTFVLPVFSRSVKSHFSVYYFRHRIMYSFSCVHLRASYLLGNRTKAWPDLKSCTEFYCCCCCCNSTNVLTVDCIGVEVIALGIGLAMR